MRGPLHYICESAQNHADGLYARSAIFFSQVSHLRTPYVMTSTHCRRGGRRHRVSNKHLAAGRDEFVSRSGDRPGWMLDENLHHTSASLAREQP